MTEIEREERIIFLWDEVERALPYETIGKVRTIVLEVLEKMSDEDLQEEYECHDGEILN